MQSPYTPASVPKFSSILNRRHNRDWRVRPTSRARQGRQQTNPLPASCSPPFLGRQPIARIAAQQQSRPPTAQPCDFAAGLVMTLTTQIAHGAQKRPACASAAETRCVEMMSARIANSRNAIVGSCLRHLRLLSVWRCLGVRLFLLPKPRRQVFQRRLSVPGRCLHQNQMRLRWLDCRFPDRAHQQCRQNQGHGWSDTHGRYSVCQAA